MENYNKFGTFTKFLQIPKALNKFVQKDFNQILTNSHFANKFLGKLIRTTPTALLPAGTIQFV